MTSRAVQWWSVPPAGQVSYLLGATPELLRIAVDPLPSNAPAVVRFCPGTGGPPADQVTVLLEELDRAAIALFPRWLPGGERLDESVALAVPAARELAARRSAQSRDFGPFLADLAERALRTRAAGTRFPAEVRARGLARVVARAYRCASLALLVEVPDGLPPDDERALIAAVEWLAQHGRLTVWLVGAPLQVVDRVPTVPVTLPGYLSQLPAEAARLARQGGPDRSGTTGPPAGAVRAATFWYPPVSGAPSPASAAELALERALAPHEWARGRCWNYRYEWHPLAQPYRLDIFWPTECLVVEVDGDDHRERLKFADDRRRDVQLHQLGQVVARFTNEDVLRDVQGVLRKIESLLIRRRTADG